MSEETGLTYGQVQHWSAHNHRADSLLHSGIAFQALIRFACRV